MGAGCSSAAVAPDQRPSGSTASRRDSSRRHSDDPNYSPGHHTLLHSVEKLAKRGSKEKSRDARATAQLALLGASAVGKSTLMRVLQQDIRKGVGDAPANRTVSGSIGALPSSAAAPHPHGVAAASPPPRNTRVQLTHRNDRVPLQSETKSEIASLRAHLFYVLREVLMAMRSLGVPFRDEGLGRRAWELTELQMLDSHSDLMAYSSELHAILSDPAVVDVLLRPDEAELSWQTPWFLMQHQRILSAAYTPEPQDLVRLRVRTAGVARHQLVRMSHDVTLVDVGGMRADRHKWPAAYRQTTLALFVASLADFSRTLSEDGTTNRLSESVELFEATCRTLEEQNTPYCLVLTHEDQLCRLLKADPRKAADQLHKALGIAIDVDAHGGDEAALHVAMVDAIRMRFASCGRPVMTLVLDSTDCYDSRKLLDAAVLLGLVHSVRSERGTALVPFEVDAEDAREILSHVPAANAAGGEAKSTLRRAFIADENLSSHAKGKS